MKIVFLNIYNGLVERGAERSTGELGEQLSKDHEVHLIQGGPSKNSRLVVYQIKPLLPDFPDTSLSFWRKLYLDVWSLQILIFTLFSVPYLFRQRFDIVIPTNGGWQTLICRIVTLVLGSKMIVVGRAGIGRDDRWNLLMQPDVFVALTSLALHWTRKYYQESKIVHIPNGIDLEKFTPEGQRIKFDLSYPVILTVASLMPNKNIELTIKAVAKLSNASLVVIGNGVLRQKLERLGMNLLGKKRFLIFYADYKEMPKYYRAAKIFTLVSNTGEAFGNVYLEAMATKLPIVATNDQSRREIIGNAGLYVNPNDIEEYSKSLERAIFRDFDNIPIKQARKFSWEKISKQYEKLFLSLR